MPASKNIFFRLLHFLPGYILRPVKHFDHIFRHWLHFVVSKINLKCNRLHFPPGYISRINTCHAYVIAARYILGPVSNTSLWHYSTLENVCWHMKNVAKTQYRSNKFGISLIEICRTLKNAGKGFHKLECIEDVQKFWSCSKLSIHASVWF